MQFRLAHTEVTSLNLEKLELSEDSAINDSLGQGYKLKLGIFPDSRHPEIFGVSFDMELVHQQEFKIEVRFLAWFECSEPPTKEELESPFALVNAPAIAFPYLRSYVSLVTLNSGFRPAMLNTVNFMKMYKESKTRERSKTHT